MARHSWTGWNRAGWKPRTWRPCPAGRPADAGDLLADAPARLQQQLYDAFDLQALYKKNMHQVTIHVTITDSTPRAVSALINDASDHPGSTAPEPAGQAQFSDLAQAPIGAQGKSEKIMTACPSQHLAIEWTASLPATRRRRATAS